MPLLDDPIEGIFNPRGRRVMRNYWVVRRDIFSYASDHSRKLSDPILVLSSKLPSPTVRIHLSI
jgi:hypothetical protein